MAPVLVLFAHPALEKSRVQRRLLDAVPARPGLTVHDLYEAYPDYDVDVAHEQALLAAHDVVVLQFPFYWYSTPPLLKQWEDLVLEHGWAYGSRGRMLEGKRLLCAVSTGGPASAYGEGSMNRFTVRQLLAPVEQTARLCRMTFLPPFLVHGTHRMPDEEVATAAGRYAALLAALADDRFPALSQAALDAHDTIAPLLDAVPGVGAAAGAPLAGARA